MFSEATSIIAMASGASIALVQSHRHPLGLTRLLLMAVAGALSNLAVLGISGLLGESNAFLTALHGIAGHLMLPLVATATGLWFGASFSDIRQRPPQVFLRSLFLLLLCFFCLSNTWTGYAGPSWIDPRVDPETHLRFQVIHRWAVPVLIGTMLLFWLRRLAARLRRATRESQLS